MCSDVVPVERSGLRGNSRAGATQQGAVKHGRRNAYGSADLYVMCDPPQSVF